MTTTAGTINHATEIEPLTWAGRALAVSFGLLYTELFLTADAAAPNTWRGLISDSLILTVAGALALVLAKTARSGRRGKALGVTALVLTVIFSLPFWTGAAIVLGATTYALNTERRPLAIIGAGFAILAAAFLVVEAVLNFAPGLPS